MKAASLLRLGRPEYWWQPAQLLRRAWRVLLQTNTRESAVIRLPWGFPITVDPRESIGRSIVALNTLDLCVSESIWRLLDPGETCADIGANIGYMTSLMAARLRKGGIVVAFEPVPLLARALQENVERWRPLTRARIEVCECAVAAAVGTATLHVPATFASNRGQASLTPKTDPGSDHGSMQTLTVSTVRLADFAAKMGKLSVVKIDVEGFEAEVLRGAEPLLRDGRIRDIVFEEHGGADAESLHFLRGMGYEIFRVARRFTGPLLQPPHAPASAEPEAPTYLATNDPARARARFKRGGWHVLRASSHHA